VALAVERVSVGSEFLSFAVYVIDTDENGNDRREIACGNGSEPVTMSERDDEFCSFGKKRYPKLRSELFVMGSDMKEEEDMMKERFRKKMKGKKKFRNNVWISR
jgi:hypothetical protein